MMKNRTVPFFLCKRRYKIIIGITICIIALIVILDYKSITKCKTTDTDAIKSIESYVSSIKLDCCNSIEAVSKQSHADNNIDWDRLRETYGWGEAFWLKIKSYFRTIATGLSDIQRKYLNRNVLINTKLLRSDGYNYEISCDDASVVGFYRTHEQPMKLGSSDASKETIQQRKIESAAEAKLIAFDALTSMLMLDDEQIENLKINKVANTNALWIIKFDRYANGYRVVDSWIEIHISESTGEIESFRKNFLDYMVSKPDIQASQGDIVEKSYYLMADIVGNKAWPLLSDNYKLKQVETVYIQPSYFGIRQQRYILAVEVNYRYEIPSVKDDEIHTAAEAKAYIQNGLENYYALGQPPEYVVMRFDLKSGKHLSTVKSSEPFSLHYVKGKR